MAARDELDLGTGVSLEAETIRRIPNSPEGSREEAEGGHAGAFHRHRSLLFGIAYRMLGSAADAEDLLQETFIRWQGAPERDIESPRSFLVTILTRLCINHLQSARTKRELYAGQWLPEPLVTAPRQNPLISLEIDESLSFAFLLLLERLTPVERAVLVLHEVFDYQYREVATILEQSEASCRQILRRARLHIREDRVRFDTTPEQREELLRRFMEASSRGNMEGLVALLAEEAIFYSDGGGKAPALPNPLYGAKNIARGILGARKKLVPRNQVPRFVQINGQPGIVSFVDNRPFSVLTVEVANGLISRIYVINNPEKLDRVPQLAALALFERLQVFQ
jgi:RNA polymerase sigma-70 factor, ECF subfamily